jgi:hydrogenase expression/formation protein HypE
MEEIASEADKIGVAVIGGHTEVTSAVTRMVLSITALGRTLVDKLITTGGARPGDWLYLSKVAAIEGTTIIAAEKSIELKDWLTPEDLREVETLNQSLSVLGEGRIAAEVGVTAMHDVTEGGVLGAIWELCEASEVGCTVWQSEIVIPGVTERLAIRYAFDPLCLIGSGAMLMTVSPELAVQLEYKSEAAGITIRRIGMIEEKLVPRRLVGPDLQISEIGRPDVDPLYRVLKL